MLQPAVDFLLAWYNLPFTLMLLACLVLAGMQWVGLGGEQDSEHDADASADHDIDQDVDLHAELDHDVDLHADLDHDVDLHADVDHDFDHSVDHDVDHDVDHGADHDADQEVTAGHAAAAGAGTGFNLLAFVGMGKAPLMVVLLILFGSTGLAGWAFNGMVRGVIGFFPALWLALTLPLAILAGVLISARVSRFIGRVLPPLSTTAISEHALVGRRATVVSPWIDDKYGMVRLRDAAGTQISLFAVTQPGCEPIRRGEEVVLMTFEPGKRVYFVEKR